MISIGWNLYNSLLELSKFNCIRIIIILILFTRIKLFNYSILRFSIYQDLVMNFRVKMNVVLVPYPLVKIILKNVLMVFTQNNYPAHHLLVSNLLVNYFSWIYLYYIINIIFISIKKKTFIVCILEYLRFHLKLSS